MELLSLVIGLLGLVLGIYSMWQFSNGVRISALIYIRTLINRMEEEKQKFALDSPQRNAMHHTQQDLEALFKSLELIFKISPKRLPK